jgi:hypothetical protein
MQCHMWEEILAVDYVQHLTLDSQMHHNVMLNLEEKYRHDTGS